MYVIYVCVIIVSLVLFVIFKYMCFFFYCLCYCVVVVVLAVALEPELVVERAVQGEDHAVRLSPARRPLYYYVISTCVILRYNTM